MIYLVFLVAFIYQKCFQCTILIQTLALKFILFESDACRLDWGAAKLLWWLQGPESQKRLRTTALARQIFGLKFNFY